ncbi:hypothetical protein GCM10007096_19360 [Pullulanibacillus pueri]|uniref:Uncharacterized protein n=1 Tax=Pullulanibacillus pueri TaxID=1437324 RepID=A0A8J2ZWH3_9BACL|nr:hypothetical protein GCM10007096_19360 [Pullulanibacillus pueri]
MEVTEKVKSRIELQKYARLLREQRARRDPTKHTLSGPEETRGSPAESEYISAFKYHIHVFQWPR